MLERLTNQGHRYALAAVAAGVVVFLVEAIDRLIVLGPSFLSPGEAFLFVVYLSPAVLMGLTFGLLAGVVLLAAGALREVSTLATGRVSGRWAGLAGTIAALLALAAIAWAMTAMSPGLVEEPLQKLVNKIDDRIVRIPAIVANFKILLGVSYVVAAAALLGLDALVGASSERARRWAGAAIGLAALALFGVIYGVDSRIFFGRYELSMHLPALGAMLGCAFVASAVSLGIFGIVSIRRAAAIAAIATVAVSGLAFGFSLWHHGSNENVKALVWRRSIIARRAYQAAAMLTDRDRDGFSGWLEGDTDDGNPLVNPVATEIPGDGVDQNGIGGDSVARETGSAFDGAAHGPGKAKNLILISIDTLRADRMSVYGYGRPTTPRLEEIGGRGVVFERAYSQGSNTGQSFASMQRSATRASVFTPSAPTLFRRLLDSGMRTTFINARRDNVWLETKRWVKYRGIILDGVETYDHRDGDPLWDADRVTDRAIEYLGSLPAGTRHATWIHYLDPHEPRKKMAPFDWGNSASDKYDTEVAFTDVHVGRLFDYLESSGALQNSIVVLVSDHGEAFLDHGMDLHGNRPYGDQLHVPLMMWAPDVAPARIREPVGVIDLAPSVLMYLGLEPIPGAEGRDILRSEVSPRPVFHETPLNLVEVSFFAYAVTVGDWKYILDVRGNTVELYDLASDPAELRNLVDARPDKASELRAVLAAWLDSTGSVSTLKSL